MILILIVILSTHIYSVGLRLQQYFAKAYHYGSDRGGDTSGKEPYFFSLRLYTYLIFNSLLNTSARVFRPSPVVWMTGHGSGSRRINTLSLMKAIAS